MGFNTIKTLPYFFTVVVMSLCLSLTGCYEIDAPEGVIATVNGEPIYLRTVQALLDSRSAGLGTFQRSTLEHMKRQYGEALGTLIIHTLVRQELQRLHIPVNDDTLNKRLDEIRNGYGGDELAKFFADASLDETDWRNLMRDHLSMISFEKRVLLPSIRIELPMVRDYYNEHQAQFHIPATMHACFAAAERRESLDAFSATFPKEIETSTEVVAQCLDITDTDVPPSWKKEMRTLAPGTCAPPRKESNTWQTICLTDRRDARTLGIAAAYPVIERILLEQEKMAAFDHWLKGSLAGAAVKVSPNIKEALLTPPLISGSPQPQPYQPPDEDEDTNGHGQEKSDATREE